MTRLSNDTGRAYEYAFISLLNEEISQVRLSKIDETSAFNAGKRAWDSIDSQERENLKQGRAELEVRCEYRSYASCNSYL